MSNFNNPLDNIRVASPCSANWDEMFGDDRKRFCGDCKLNVYNLSNMTRRQAESLIISSEGRLCVRFFRRADGTVLTKNCPVGWAAVKQRVSRVATAVFSMIAGLVTGIVGFNLLPSETEATTGVSAVTVPNVTTMGDVEGTPEVGEMGLTTADPAGWERGRMTMGKPMITVKPQATR